MRRNPLLNQHTLNVVSRALSITSSRKLHRDPTRELEQIATALCGLLHAELLPNLARHRIENLKLPTLHGISVVPTGSPSSDGP
jgi:hypothetical protein